MESDELVEAIDDLLANQTETTTASLHDIGLKLETEPGRDHNQQLKIAAKLSQLCGGLSQSGDAEMLEQVKQVFYKANSMFLEQCNGASQMTNWEDCLEFVRNCSKLDVKAFLQSSKQLVNLILKQATEDQATMVGCLLEFLQSVLVGDYLTAKTASSLKAAGFILRIVGMLLKSPVVLSEQSQVFQLFSTLQHAQLFYLENENLRGAFDQSITPVFAVLLPVLFQRRTDLLHLFVEFSADRDKGQSIVLAAAFLYYIGENSVKLDNLPVFVASYLSLHQEWILSKRFKTEWPWPIPTESITDSDPHTFSISLLSKAIICQNDESVLLQVTEQLLQSLLSTESSELERLLCSDILSTLSQSSGSLAFSVIGVLVSYCGNQTEFDTSSTLLIPLTVRRLFAQLPDDQRAQLVQEKLSGLIGSFAHLFKQRSSGVYSMNEAFRVLESGIQALVSNALRPEDDSFLLLQSCLELYAYLAWWTSTSPEMIKSFKATLEKLTFSLWSVFAMIAADPEIPKPLLVIFAFALFQASKCAIIGVNNFEASSKFWTALDQYLDIAQLPDYLSQLFCCWLLKTVDSNTFGQCQACQKILLKSLQHGKVEVAVRGAFLQNVSNRLKSTGLNNLSDNLDPKLKIHAEAFSHQLLCMPFSDLP